MGILETLLKAKKNVRSKGENVLECKSDMVLSTVRREILDRVKSRIIDDSGRRLFPFGKMMVRITLQTETQKIAISEALLKKEAIKSEILQMLRQAEVRCPDEFEILFDFGTGGDDGSSQSLAMPVLEMEFFKHSVLSNGKVPETKLLILKGVTEKPEYALKNARILIGRSAEVLDREGRIIRRNDVVFLESGEEANCSVDRTHARIWFDGERDAFFIVDEGSRYGTRVLRGGAVVEVPSGEPDGIRLQSGDEVCLGQASLRFSLLGLSTLKPGM